MAAEGFGVLAQADEIKVATPTDWAAEVVLTLRAARSPTALFGDGRRQAKRLADRVDWRSVLERPFPGLPREIADRLRELGLREIRSRAHRHKERPPYVEDIEETERRCLEKHLEPGAVSALVSYLPDAPDGALPRTYRMAAELDTLCWTLLQHRLNDSMRKYKDLLIDALSAPGEHWIEFDVDSKALRASEDWGFLSKAQYLIHISHTIPLLAMWDAEYCSTRFANFEPTPVFWQLFPQPGRGPGRRNVGPMQRTTGVGQFLDFALCLFEYKATGKWPRAQIEDQEIARLFQQRLKLSENDNLPKLRAGQSLMTTAVLQRIWPDDITDSSGVVVPPLTTLLAIAHAWDSLLPLLRHFELDDLYLAAWRNAHKASTSKSDTAIANQWPAYLRRGLV